MTGGTRFLKSIFRKPLCNNLIEKNFLVIYVHLNWNFLRLTVDKMTYKRARYFKCYTTSFLIYFLLEPKWFIQWLTVDIESFCHMSGIQISIFHGCVIHDLNMWFHIVILYCATSIAMNMKGNRSASRDIKHWIMHNSYFRRPPKTFFFEVFECIKINFLSQLATHQDT